jgi:hypothetical protein
MKIDLLIEEMTPLYNLYKANGTDMSASESIKLMWDIGHLIKQFVTLNNVAPHNLYRQIYGMGEGASHVVRKSWITREFQGRCYRIRNIFKNKAEIDQLFPRLISFTLFRECMPFFDNPKYILRGADKEELVAMLNSNKSGKYILAQIRKIQKEKIGINNDRNQRLNELEDEKQKFITFYNYIFNLLKKPKYEQKIVLEKNSITKNFLDALIKNTNSLTQDGLANTILPQLEGCEDKVWQNYCNLVAFFEKQKDPKNIRRFRRLVPSERIFRVAEMLYTLSKAV